MSDKINKSSLKEAKANFDEIKKFALEEATKNLEKDVSKKVVELMNKSLEGDVVNEEVTINADGTTITIDDSGDVTVDAEGGEMDVNGLDGLEGGEMGIEPAGEPIDMDSDEIVVSDEEDEIEIDTEIDTEIDEMNNLEEMSFEEQEMAAAAPEAAPVAPEAAPAEEMPMDMPAEEMPAEDAMANPFEMIADKLDQLMSMMGGGAEAGGEEIEIVDDAAAMAPAPEAAPVAEEITFEVVNNEMMEPEEDVLEIVAPDVNGEPWDEEPELPELQEDIVDENTMSGVGNAPRRAAGNQGESHGRTKPEVAAKRKRLNVSENTNKENKAQHEAKFAELIKENESLKSKSEELEGQLIKFENGFIKLQENFGKMQDYNAKLVMAYKVAMSGGLTTDEKIQISEQFDKCETVKDAETLYKSIVNEHKIKVNKNPEKSIKATSIKSTPAKSQSQPLYESREVARMKQLAGIKNLNG